MIFDTSVLDLELRTAFKNYLYAYFTMRDYEETIRLFHPQLCVFGTASDEVGLSYTESLALYVRDIEQCPEPINYEMLFSRVIPLAPNTGLIVAGMNLAGAINSQPFTVDALRVSILFIKCNQQWLIQHMHLSQEQTNIEEGESFPLADIKKKNQLLEEMISERTKELSKALAEIEIIATTDNLTGLYNRRKFDTIFAYEIQRAKNFTTSMSIILGDIDYFKKVNDIHGHLVGDEILKIVSRLLQQHIRPMDILARWGGEEFIILLPETSGIIATKIAEKLRHLLYLSKNKYHIPLSISFGVAEYVQNDTEVSWLKRADVALYRAKNTGRNKVVF